ncbi:HAD-IA family hydrolase [Desulfitobacterium hafniense]|uniref:HAD-IA family hydrolase n=1 Tax=Desulfitobacterium hafniense TaxID=49338 RepID=UPI0003622B01|nr:HAD-IA family hydrolase [Desulfitobacterium hafniense]
MIDDLMNLLDAHHYKMISIDIYDTLLLRMVRKPDHLFELMYKRSPDLFPDHIDGDDWREIRTRTEVDARKDIFTETGRKEITLPDIYNRLPSIIKNRNEILKLELECEKGYSYVNEEIAEFLKYVRNRNMKIVLTSDMYLSADNLKVILTHNNFDLSSVDRIYVSSDCNATKKTGELFRKILDDYKIAPEDMLHVGDHRISDFSVPRGMGISAYWYDLIRTASLSYPQLRIEEAVFGNICGEIFATRLIAALNAPKADEERFWYGLGAMELGPLMTLATEWVLDIAEKESIKQIFPLMREGKFLSELLLQAKAARKSDVRIKPLYISRKALYPALLGVLKEKDIQYLLTTHQMKLKSLLELLQIEEVKSEFAQYLDVEINALKQVVDNHGKSIYAILERKIKDKAYLNDIKARNQEADVLLFRYLTQMGMTHEPYLTFDIGWRGNVQNAIQRIMNKNKVLTQGIHLLMNGKKFILNERNLEDSCDIRGYTGNFGKNEKEITGLTNHVLELFLMCDEGTTVGYQDQDGQALPVTQKIDYDENQKRAVRLVQMGALNFQREYLKLKAKKSQQLLGSDYEKETLRLMLRLLQYPTTREAKMIGNLSFDQNFGIDAQWKIISQSELDVYQKWGYGRFVHEGKARLDEWYRGLDAVINPLGYIKEALFFHRNSENYQMLLFAERIMRAYGDSMVLVGAGKDCFWLLPYLEMADRLQDVEVILDSRSALLGASLKGIPVKDYTAELNQKSFVITPINAEVVQKLSQEIRKHYGEDVLIFDYYTKLSEWGNKENV